MTVTRLKPYRAPAKASETEFVVNRSRFIGRCFPVSSEEEALAKLESVRKQCCDATHNCYAYSLLGGIRRFSDDGEPGGTAGMPIMDTLIRTETENALIVVTRYFGGILLGSGGLVRAYSRSASDALNASGRIMMTPADLVEFTVDYTRYGALEGFVRQNSVVVSTEFSDSILFRCLVETERTEAFIADVVEKTDGRSRPVVVGEEYLPIHQQ